MSTAVFSARTFVAKPASANSSVDITAPAPNVTESGTFQLTAAVRGYPQTAYDMFWYVDNGQWNWMGSSADGSAKQAVIDVSGWHWHTTNNNYTIVVVAVLHANGRRVYSGVPISVATSEPTTTTATPTGAVLYVNPGSDATQIAATTNDPTMKRIMTKLAATPTAVWLGSWNANVESDVAAIVDRASNAHQVPVFVAYNIPDRDCGGYSSGGASSPDTYKSWVQGIASGIGTQSAIVILEPDALAQTSCLNAADLSTRNALLSFAVTTLKSNSNTKVYIDAGNPSWIPVATMAARLQAAGVDRADGFSLNVSNFIATSDNITYGDELSKLVGGKHFVIDTGRNGNGSSGEWCNPSGRALGAAPTANTGNQLLDYLLWIKTPGESDGTCNGGPAAGVWWPAYAENLGINAGW